MFFVSASVVYYVLSCQLPSFTMFALLNLSLWSCSLECIEDDHRRIVRGPRGCADFAHKQYAGWAPLIKISFICMSYLYWQTGMKEWFIWPSALKYLSASMTQVRTKDQKPSNQSHDCKLFSNKEIRMSIDFAGDDFGQVEVHKHAVSTPPDIMWPANRILRTWGPTCANRDRSLTRSTRASADTHIAWWWSVAPDVCGAIISSVFTWASIVKTIRDSWSWALVITAFWRNS